MRQMKKPATKVNPYKGDIDYVSKMGYRDDSPFNNRPYIDIYTPSGMIDMSSTGIPLIANGMYLPPYSGMYQFEPGIVREQRIPMAQKGQQVEDNDSWLENIAEIIDPTGISSWDDVYRAYKNTGLSGETALEVLGAIPLLGKVSKVTKPGIHLIKYSGIDQILRNTLPRNKFLSRFANVASKTGRGTDTVQAVLGAKDNSGFTWDMRHGEVPKFGGRNIFPQIDLGEHGDFAYGGDPSLPKQMYNSQVGVPLNTNDFIYTPEELEKYKNIYDQRIVNCKKGDAACLEQANNYYNLYVAPKLNAPSTWDIAEKMGITTGPNNPRVKEYGIAADSWDLPGLYKQSGAKVNLAAPIKNPSEIQNKLASMSDEDLKRYWINMNLPLGALVNFGQAGLDEHYGKGQAYNISQGLVPSNHSARVLGYSPEGVPYIYDYGRITPITDPTFRSMPLTTITSPQEIQGYTFENLKKQGKLEGSKMTPLKIKTKGADYDPDEYEPFITSLQKNKDMYANALGMSDEEYNNYAKHATALALTETGGGDDTAIRWKGIIPVPSYITDKLGFGDTKGITQINPDVLFNKKSLADKLESVGIRKDNYDPWNPDHAAIATMALLKDNRAVQDKYAKTSGNKADLSEAEKTYYQWSMPRTLRKGEAKGESEKIKRYLENYNKIQAHFDSHNRYLAENRKFGGMYSKTHTHMKEGGWLDELDEEYRRGGSVNPLMRSRSKRSTTKKNIQSSINKIFLRNYDLFGPGGKNIYDPKSKYQQGGDWLDNLD